MTLRTLDPPIGSPRILEPEAEALERADLLQRLHRFAHATGAQPGDDVLRHFDGRLRSAQERQEHAARGG